MAFGAIINKIEENQNITFLAHIILPMSHWESFKKMLLRQEKHFRLLSKLKKIGMKIFDLQFYFDVILHLEENNLSYLLIRVHQFPIRVE